MAQGAFPSGSDDERELLLEWLNDLRGAVIRNLKGLDEMQARWQPEGKLVSLIGHQPMTRCVSPG
jgi:hypothetical protein